MCAMRHCLSLWWPQMWDCYTVPFLSGEAIINLLHSQRLFDVGRPYFQSALISEIDLYGSVENDCSIQVWW